MVYNWRISVCHYIGWCITYSSMFIVTLDRVYGWHVSDYRYIERGITDASVFTVTLDGVNLTPQFVLWLHYNGVYLQRQWLLLLEWHLPATSEWRSLRWSGVYLTHQCVSLHWHCSDILHHFIANCIKMHPVVKWFL